MARQCEPAGPWDNAGLDREDVPTYHGPRQAGGRSHRLLLLDQGILVAARSQPVLERHLGSHRGIRLARHPTPRDLAANCGELTFQLADTGLPGPTTDQTQQRLVVDDEAVWGYAVLLQLSRQQVPPCDGDLLPVGVARELDHLHPVNERGRDGIEEVCGTDKEDAGEVVRDVQVVIHKRVVLCRVEKLQQSGCRISLEAHRQLFNLVEHENGVAGTGPAYPLDDPARQRPHVGTPMATDVSLIADSAERCPHERPAQCPRDGLTERRLADAGRSDQTQDQPAAGAAELGDREIADDAILHPLEPVVVVVEHLPRLVEVHRVRRGVRPGQTEYPVEASPDHGILGRGGVDALQPGELPGDLGLHLVWEAPGVDLGSDVGDLTLLSIQLAQLLTDCSELLSKDVLPLLLARPLAGLSLDLRRHFEVSALLLTQLQGELQSW